MSHWRDYETSVSKYGAKGGTITHLPPEYWLHDDLSKDPEPYPAWDMYGFSILTWELMTEEKVYQGKTRKHYVYLNDNQLKK